jgi:hypothetical protein
MSPEKTRCDFTPEKSALSRLEAGVLFIDHVNPAFTADDTAVFITRFGGFQ